MNNIQINGQRRWGPPDNWIGPPPEHGTEIFIKNLPEEVFELELYTVFSKVAPIYEVRLPVNWNGFNRGYAFLRFTTVGGADRAIQEFDGFEIRSNRKIKVSRSIDNTRLFLSAVPIEKNADELKNELLAFVENIKKVYVYPTLENRAVFRGYAFVEFDTHRDAAIAKRILTPDICYGIFKKKCIAAWANPLPFLDQSILKSLNVLFMRNIPADVKGFHLKKLIENLIGAEEIKRIKRLNDFAFLTFKDHKSAERALGCLQSTPFLIPDHETQVEWAIPREMAVSSLSSIGKDCEDVIIPRRRTGRSISGPRNEYDAYTCKEMTYPQTLSTFTHDTSEVQGCRDEYLKSDDYTAAALLQIENMLADMNRLKPEMFEKKGLLSPLSLTQQEVPSNTCNYLESENIQKSFPAISSRSKFSHAEYIPLQTVWKKNYLGSTFSGTHSPSVLNVHEGPVKGPGHVEFFESSIEGKGSAGSARTVPCRENAEEYLFAGNYSPDSDYGSRDSEEGFFNICRLNNSPYSSPRTSASINGCLGSPTHIFTSVEQDFPPFNQIESIIFQK